jgi:hypothetical protein
VKTKTAVKNRAIIEVYGKEWKKIPEAKKVVGQGRNAYFNKITVPTGREKVLTRRVFGGQIISFDFITKDGGKARVTVYNENKKDSSIYVQEGEPKTLEIPADYRQTVEAFLKVKGFWLPELTKSLSGAGYSYLDHFINPVTGEIKTIFDLVAIEDYQDFAVFPDLIGKIGAMGLELCGRAFGAKNVFIGEVGKANVLFDSFMITLDEDGVISELCWAGEGLIQKAQKAASFSMFHEVVYEEGSLEDSLVYTVGEKEEKLRGLKAKDIVSLDMTVSEIKDRELFIDRIIASQKVAAGIAQKFSKKGKSAKQKFMEIAAELLFAKRVWLLRNGVLYTLGEGKTLEIGKLVALVAQMQLDLRIVDLLYGYTKMF